MANLLTCFRIFLLLPIAWALLSGAHWLAFWLFVLAGLTDLLDGALARALGDADALGAALDPIADKILTAGLLVLLAMTGALFGPHIFAALLILIREFLIGGLREALAGKLSLPVSALAKWKTALQFIALALLIMPLSWGQNIGLAALWAAAVLTLWTGWTYARPALAALKKAGQIR
jgi:CDP-diacylglycerol---glycerol-3-phosphate 3-phosphatidyltransferase